MVRKELSHHIESAHGSLNDERSQILKAHEMMLDDKPVMERIEDRIEHDLMNAEWAVSAELEDLVARFAGIGDPYLQARSEDIRDLAFCVLEVLSRGKALSPENAADGSPQIMVTQNLYPSLAIKAHNQHVAGFVTESVAISSHAAILLKGLGIPVVGAVENLSQSVHPGEEVVVDGINGLVVIRPNAKTLEKYRRMIEDLVYHPSVDQIHPQITKTCDGTPVTLMANIEHPNQVSLVLQKKMGGIGLFRTEFFALEQGSIPSEDKQYHIYRAIIDRLKGKTVVIRTLDIGADKRTPGLHRCAGSNPALGVRGIRRHLLREPEELCVQFRAILRASVDASVCILLPMITDVGDVRKAREYLTACKEELTARGLSFNDEVKLGAMIEIPSAAILAFEILQEVDFISIGTNDLLQYLTGADRDNPDVLRYYDPQNVAFRWLLAHILEGARKLGREKDVTICGEIAANPQIVPLLLKMGFRCFSIPPVDSEEIRNVIAHVSLCEG